MTKTLFHSTFSGLSDGAAPPSWSKFDVRGAWSMDVQGEALSIRGSNSTAPFTQWVASHKVTPDCEFSGRVRIFDNAVDAPHITFLHKTDGLRMSTIGSGGLFYNGWNIKFYSTSLQLIYFEGANGTSTDPGGGVRLGYELRYTGAWNLTTDWLRYRIQFIGALVRIKYWRDGDAEPADWYEFVDVWGGADHFPLAWPPTGGVYLGGTIGVVTKGNTSADVIDIRLDDFKVENVGRQHYHEDSGLWTPGHYRRHNGSGVWVFERPRLETPVGSGRALHRDEWSLTHEEIALIATARVNNVTATTLNLSITGAAQLTKMVPGDKLIAVTRMTASAEGAITPPVAVNGVAWTKLQTVAVGTQFLQLWERVVQPGETGSYVWTSDTSATANGKMFVYRGIGAFDQFAETPNSGGASISTLALNPITTTQAQELVLSVVSTPANPGTQHQWESGPYIFPIAPIVNEAIWEGHRLVKAIGTYGATAKWFQARSNITGMMASWKAKAR